MKVALYIPPFSVSPDGDAMPSLGSLLLAAILERDGFDARVFDMRTDPEALTSLVAFAPAVMGISVVTPSYKTGLAAASQVRKVLPGVITVFGGAHAHALPAEVAAAPECSCAFLGECEHSFLLFCQGIRNGKTPAELEIPGTAVMLDKGVVVREARPLMSGAELDLLPPPAFHRMNLDRYFASTKTHGLFSRGRRILPTMSSRGCPHACTYCCRVMGKKLRHRDPDLFLEETFQLVAKYQIDELFIEDDNFTAARPRALHILSRLAKHPTPLFLKFANGLRADAVDEELLLAMRAANVYSVSFGIESGSNATLRRMRKNLDLSVAVESIKLAKRLGFLVGSNCIIGYPGETKEDVEESLDFFLRLPLDSMAIVNLIPFPGTAARAECEQNGWLTPEAADWDNYYFSINNPKVLINTSFLSAEDIKKYIASAYRRMYLRPSWALRHFREIGLRRAVSGLATLLFPKR